MCFSFYVGQASLFNPLRLGLEAAGIDAYGSDEADAERLRIFRSIVPQPHAQARCRKLRHADRSRTKPTVSLAVVQQPSPLISKPAESLPVAQQPELPASLNELQGVQVFSLFFGFVYVKIRTFA